MCARNFKRNIAAKPSLPTSSQALPLLPMPTFHSHSVEFHSRGSGQLQTSETGSGSGALDLVKHWFLSCAVQRGGLLVLVMM